MPTIKTGIRFSKKQPLSEQELRHGLSREPTI